MQRRIDMMAKWKFNSDHKIICSNCGYVLSDLKHIPEELNEYCPNCKQYMKNSYQDERKTLSFS